MSIGAALAASAAYSSPVNPLSYDMPNGDGVLSGGSFNYWDLNYTGSGNTSLDGDPLSGGLGDLTDGIIATENWFTTENLDGTGPYVGWRAGLNGNPLITFNFASGTVIETLTVFVDDSDGNGGVDLPDAVVINGTSYDVDQFLIGTEPKSFTFSNLGFAGETLTVELITSADWVFASEITFDSEPVPEPITMVVLGAGMIGFLRRKRRS